LILFSSQFSKYTVLVDENMILGGYETIVTMEVSEPSSKRLDTLKRICLAIRPPLMASTSLSTLAFDGHVFIAGEAGHR
jgi:hypothetical protein